LDRSPRAATAARKSAGCDVDATVMRWRPSSTDAVEKVTGSAASAVNGRRARAAKQLRLCIFEEVITNLLDRGFRSGREFRRRAGMTAFAGFFGAAANVEVAAFLGD
jgi:hypothetical protein